MEKIQSALGRTRKEEKRPKGREERGKKSELNCIARVRYCVCTSGRSGQRMHIPIVYTLYIYEASGANNTNAVPIRIYSNATTRNLKGSALSRVRRPCPHLLFCFDVHPWHAAAHGGFGPLPKVGQSSRSLSLSLLACNSCTYTHTDDATSCRCDFN